MTQEEIKTAQGSVLFNSVPSLLLAPRLSGYHKRTIHRGETLFLQGDPASHMYVILTGCLKLVRLTQGGDEIVVAVYTAGDSFGEAAALKRGLYPVTVEAVQDCTLIQIEARVMLEALREDPELAVAMLGATFNHLHELVIEIEKLKALSGVQRLATFLISLTPMEEGACTLVLPYDKVLIAKQLGMKPESLSRNFASLRSRGVTVSRQSVAVKDIAKLKLFVSGEENDQYRQVGY
ncbi:MAG: Crp/Fnr family transcriptional regulator [Rhodobacteraceae bacterium]|nr:Crp/Fnr family transcriptional regulator [Paracoccaceae bacterium]